MSGTYGLPPQIIDIHNHAHFPDDGAELIGVMDELHIQTALLLGLPESIIDGHGANPRMLEAVRRRPERFVGGCYLDPRRGPAAIDEMRHYHAEGIRVVKLFPNHGYYPDDEGLRPFFDAVAELKLAVLSHCGWLTTADTQVSAAYYSAPGRFEKLVRTYKETSFILAHMGGINGLLESIMLATRAPNLFLDCSPGQGTWALEFAGALVASIPPEKILWGADGLDPRAVLYRDREALEKIGFGPHFDKIFYSNARGLLERIGALPATPPAAPAAG